MRSLRSTGFLGPKFFWREKALLLRWCFGSKKREDGRRRKLRRGREAENHFYYYCENVSYTVVHVNLPQTFAWQRDFRPRYAPPNFYKCIFSFATRGAKAWKAAHHLLVVLKNISDVTFPYPILHLKHEKCNFGSPPPTCSYHFAP